MARQYDYIRGVPVPKGGIGNDVPADVRALAETIGFKLTNVFASAAERDAFYEGNPPDGATCYIQADNSVYVRVAGAWALWWAPPSGPWIADGGSGIQTISRTTPGPLPTPLKLAFTNPRRCLALVTLSGVIGSGTNPATPTATGGLHVSATGGLVLTPNPNAPLVAGTNYGINMAGSAVRTVTLEAGATTAEVWAHTSSTCDMRAIRLEIVPLRAA